MRSSLIRPRTGAWASMALLLGLVLACSESERAPELPDDGILRIMELGRLGGEIYNQPERAEQILDSAGLSAEEFEERVRRITNDPVLSREYSRGFEAIARPPVTGAARGPAGLPDAAQDNAGSAAPGGGPGI